jgi:hypothetical protein
MKIEYVDFISIDAEKAMKALGVKLDGINCSLGLRGVSVMLIGEERRFIGRSENEGSLSLALDVAFDKALLEAKIWHIDRQCYPHHAILLGL